MKNSSADVSVLILNYNGAKFIEACLNSVLAQDYPKMQVIVIDNNSQDDSLALAGSVAPRAEILANKENLGFAQAMNLGIDYSAGEFIITLNVDVTLEPDFVSELVAVAKRDGRIGSVSGKVYRMKNTKPLTIDTTGHVIFKNRLFTDRGDNLPDTGQFDREEEIFGTCAGASLYRRAMLADVAVNGEYFDAAFFMFLEDTDLNWRAQLRGWKSLYVPAAVAHHYRGGIAVRKTKLVELHNYKNRYFMLLKNDSFFSILKYLPHFIVTDTLKSGALLLRCPSALLGWGSVFKNLPNMIQKRRFIQKNRLIGQREFEKKWLKPFDYKSWISKHLMGS